MAKSRSPSIQKKTVASWTERRPSLRARKTVRAETPRHRPSESSSTGAPEAVSHTAPPQVSSTASAAIPRIPPRVRQPYRLFFAVSGESQSFKIFPCIVIPPFKSGPAVPLSCRRADGAVFLHDTMGAAGEARRFFKRNAGPELCVC